MLMVIGSLFSIYFYFLFSFLKELIPLGCCKSVHFSSEYIKSYECKLLGLNANTSFYAHDSHEAQPNTYPDLNDHILVDILMTAKKKRDKATKCEAQFACFEDLMRSARENYDINIISKSNVNQITQRIIIFVFNLKISSIRIKG